MNQQKFSVSGMTCQHCVARVQGLLSTVTGIDSVVVSLMPPRALVQGDNISLESLALALNNTQFTIQAIPSTGAKDS